MRIVAGQWRGRVIEAPSGLNVRPTLDRIREAWMSIMQYDIPGARVVDLFSGSGALGVEMLSRGARCADFVESDARTIRVLQSNLDLLGAGDAATVVRADALKFAKNLDADAYDVAVADPPYTGGFATALAELWLEKPFARVLSIEHNSRDKLPSAADTRRYGSSAITFYRSE